MKQESPIWRSIREKRLDATRKQDDLRSLAQDWPGLSQPLIDAMKRTWPDSLPTAGVTMEDLHVRIGMVTVWRTLEHILERLQEAQPRDHLEVNHV